MRNNDSSAIPILSERLSEDASPLKDVALQVFLEVPARETTLRSANFTMVGTATREDSYLSYQYRQAQKPGLLTVQGPSIFIMVCRRF